MPLKRAFLGVVLAVGMSVLLTGCKDMRFITAKIKTVNLDNVGDFQNLVNLVRDAEDLPAPEQPKAAQLRQNVQTYSAKTEKDLTITGDPRGEFTVYMLASSTPSPTSTFPMPVEMAIYTTTPHKKGELTKSGYAEIRFGTGGPVYTTDLNDCFFEFEVMDFTNANGDTIASGKMSFIARNKDDRQDKTRLLVMDGAFVARVK